MSERKKKINFSQLGPKPSKVSLARAGAREDELLEAISTQAIGDGSEKSAEKRSGNEKVESCFPLFYGVRVCLMVQMDGCVLV